MLVYTNGIDAAAFDGGLTQDEKATMSKHMRNKFNIDYMSELHPTALKALGRFHRDESYYVPRSQITFEGITQDITGLIFPDINTWRSQRDSVRGDKSQASSNILDALLPFLLAEVALQDNQTLRSLSAINYEAWAKEQREKLDQTTLPPIVSKKNVTIYMLHPVREGLEQVQGDTNIPTHLPEMVEQLLNEHVNFGLVRMMGIRLQGGEI